MLYQKEIIGHFPLFHGTISNGKIFGRGAIDDKGPVVSSLYAMKIIKDNYKVNKKVRLILGLNEELNWQCIDYYKKHEELPSIGFSPDADFPCIYAEKAILTCSLNSNLSFLANSDIQILQMDCNNNAINVVPKYFSTILKINSNKIDMKNFIKNLKTIIDTLGYEIDVYKIDNSSIKLTSYGVPSHAAHPDMGINAISRLLIVLYELFKSYDISVEILEFFNNFIGTEYNGKNLGIDFEDESGCLTLNVGNVDFIDNILKINMNLRIPVTISLSTICDTFETALSKSDFQNVSFDIVNHMNALYISKDNYLVKTLCNIYNEVTNSNLEPIAIGGATFARAFDNCISFGANLPGNKDMCHQTDEFISIDNLLLACKIYAMAILKLGNN